MAFGDFPPGAYEVFYDSTSLGLLEGQPRHIERITGENYKGHLFGNTTIDTVYSGIESMFVLFTLKEWNAATKAVLWPWSNTIGKFGLPFRLGSDLAKPLQLVAEPNSRAALLGPVTRTYALSILVPNSNLEIPLGGEKRDIPIVMQILPSAASNADPGGVHGANFYIDT